ncbi:MAG: alpha/beta hydrolase [Oscillospiraceae bacterium]|nr:alpha/beta hydrolase [Oscillospiraceae bacterium]
MKRLAIAFMIIAAGILAVLIASYGFFRMGFYVPPRKKRDPEAIELPEGEIYEVFWEDMKTWVRQTRAAPHEDVSIVSFDGLKLTGKYYEFAPGAPIEIMFHGYRGSAERDMSGGMQRCFNLGRSALIVDQRCSGGSEGNVITFGINEHRDCLGWVDFVRERFGPDIKIILTGMSMGAATVLMAGGEELPENVIGILADCGYNSAKDIIVSVIRKMGLPPALCYPLAKLGAKIYGHFDLEENSPEEAVKRCKVPVIFFHGDTDDYVPCEMSRINYEACASRKKLVLIPGAGHGLCYPVGMETYMKEVRAFFGPEASYRSEI